MSNKDNMNYFIGNISILSASRKGQTLYLAGYEAVNSLESWVFWKIVRVPEPLQIYACWDSSRSN